MQLLVPVSMRYEENITGQRKRHRNDERSMKPAGRSALPPTRPIYQSMSVLQVAVQGFRSEHTEQ